MVDWISCISDSLTLSEINIPGTHDSCTKYVDFPIFAKCQSMSIAEQLKSGIRFLDIRVEKEGERLKTVHGICDCKKSSFSNRKLYLDDVLTDCKSFLNSNPSETILFSVKREDGAGDEETFDTFFDSYLIDSVWYKENRIPTLKEVRGKIVLLNRCRISPSNEKYTDFNTGINLSNWVYQKQNIRKIYETAELLGRDGTLSGKAFTIQDLYGLTPTKKWSFAIAPFIENPPEVKDILITFFSCISPLFNPKASAAFINKKLVKADLEKQKKYGWIIMDYPTEDIIKKIINSNF